MTVIRLTVKLGGAMGRWLVEQELQ
eukprot:SAG11_NODE_13372_length_658_cov_0.828265_1_plen_24_part_10